MLLACTTPAAVPAATTVRLGSHLAQAHAGIGGSAHSALTAPRPFSIGVGLGSHRVVAPPLRPFAVPLRTPPSLEPGPSPGPTLEANPLQLRRMALVVPPGAP